jgi:hypothetical protein
VGKDWVEDELHNWARWANSGPMPHPTPWECMGHCCSLEGGYLPPEQTGPSDPEDLRRPPPIHVENAKLVQTVYDVAMQVEQKVLQAEYVSPWRYAAHTRGIETAVRRLNAEVPGMRLGVSGYETILASIKRRVERAFL